MRRRAARTIARLEGTAIGDSSRDSRIIAYCGGKAASRDACAGSSTLGLSIHIGQFIPGQCRPVCIPAGPFQISVVSKPWVGSDYKMGANEAHGGCFPKFPEFWVGNGEKAGMQHARTP